MLYGSAAARARSHACPVDGLCEASLADVEVLARHEHDGTPRITANHADAVLRCLLRSLQLPRMASHEYIGQAVSQS